MSTQHGESHNAAPPPPLDSISETLSDVDSTPLSKFLNTPHLPRDAGDHSAALQRLIGRIPDGWGRWVSCDAGWYGLLVDMDERIAAIAPDYHIHQVKEKFGTLRFYWSLPTPQPACCIKRAEIDPCPHRSVPLKRDDLPAALVNEFDAWCAREGEHLDSPEHAAAVADLEASGAYSLHTDRETAIAKIVADGERTAARTCELCSGPGQLHETRGWYKTLCSQCARTTGYRPV